MSVKSNSQAHTLLIQKLLISIHYLTLFKDELVLVARQPSLLPSDLSAKAVQADIWEILTTARDMEKRERLINSTFWYDEASFQVMNNSLNILGDWLSDLSQLLETCQNKQLFQTILGDSRTEAFGILADRYTSLQISYQTLTEQVADSGY